MSEIDVGYSPPLSLDQVEEFNRNGAILVRGTLDVEWVDTLSRGFDALAVTAHDLGDYYSDIDETAHASPKGHGISLSRGENWRDSREMHDYIFNSPIGALAATLLQSQEVRFFEDLLIYRSAGAARPTPWHQDSPQNPLVGQQQCSIWLSLDRTTPETGGLRFIAGTHRGPNYIPYVPADQRALVERDMRFFEGGPLPDFDSDPGRFKVISFDANPGDVVIFHPTVVHGAFGSAVGHPRRTLSVRFVGDDVRWQPKASVFHDWLRALELAEGAPLSAEPFPVIWPRQEGPRT